MKTRLCMLPPYHGMTSQHDDNDVNEDDLVRDLKHLDAIIARLELKRSDLKRRINHCYSPIIHQLPHDVLSVVFSFCLPDYTAFHTSLSKFDLSAPLIFGAVCRDWREAAWSSPALWSAIAINISSSNAIFELQTSLTRDWFARSGRLPLSIRIVSRSLNVDWADPDSDLLLTEFSTVVNSQSSRWHTFHLSVPPKIYHFLEPSVSSAPILESLHLHSHIPESFIGNQKFRLLHCPRLQEIRLTNVSIRRIQVPTNNITRIYADNLPIHECREILCKSPSLVHCELMNIGPWSYHKFHDIPTSTNLEYLTIHIGKAKKWSLTDFLQDIAALCLKTLTVKASGHMPKNNTIAGIPINGLRSLLFRASSLHTFSLVDAEFSLDGMMDLLRAMPTVKNLTVSAPPYREGPGETEIMLQVLAGVIASQGKPTRGGFLANLETLVFIGYRNCRPRNVPRAIPIGPWIPDHTPRRPLCSVTLKFYSPVEHLAQEMIFFLLSLKGYGISLKVCATSGPMEDLLQRSIDFHKSSSFGGVDLTDVDLGLTELETVQYEE